MRGRAGLVMLALSLLPWRAHAGAMPGRVLLADFIRSTEAGADVSDAFEAAIKALCPTPGECGGVLEIPSGVFPLGRTVAVPAGVRIRGRGGATIIQSTAPQCSEGSPSIVFVFRGSPGSVLRSGLEGLTITSEDTSHTLACAELPPGTPQETPDRPERPAMAACFRSVDGDHRVFERERMSSVGVLVEGADNFIMRDVRACRLGTGILVRNASGGFVDSAMIMWNNTGMRLEGVSDWTFDNLMLHANTVALHVRPSESGGPSRNVHVAGGQLQSSFRLAARIEGCVNCSLKGMHIENNGPQLQAGVDFHLDGSSLTRHFSNVGATHSGWAASLVESQSSGGCPVDYVSFDDDVGLKWPNALEVRSDCRLHLTADPIWMRLSRKATPTQPRLTLLDTGGGLTMDATGQVGLGGAETDSAVALHAHEPGGDLLHLQSAASEVQLRLLPNLKSPAAVLRITPGSQLEWRSGKAPGLLVSAEGGVGVGGEPTQSRLTVHGGMAAQSVTAEAWQPIESKPPACNERRRGMMLLSGGQTQICLKQSGAWRWRVVGQP